VQKVGRETKLDRLEPAQPVRQGAAKVKTPGLRSEPARPGMAMLRLATPRPVRFPATGG
jgi:hypothetical protein